MFLSEYQNLLFEKKEIHNELYFGLKCRFQVFFDFEAVVDTNTLSKSVVLYKSIRSDHHATYWLN